MKLGRRRHGCTSIGGQGVLVIGGSNRTPTLRLAELFDPVNNIWTAQPDLPTNFSNTNYPTLLNVDGRVIGLFLRDNQIYHRSDNGSDWNVLPGVQLPKEFKRFDKAVLVPDDFVSSCIA